MNIKHDVRAFAKYGNRVNAEWTIPECLGLEHNKLEDNDAHITAEIKRGYFTELMAYISEQTSLKWSVVIKAFLGSVNGSKKANLRK